MLALYLTVLAISLGAYATKITSDSSVASGRTFDYLSAKGYRVLLIEAGKDLQNNSAIYNAELRGTLNNDPATDCNWHYTGSAGNGTALPIKIDSGKCVGGGSSINGMVWYRPTSAELDAIEDLGNPGWNSTTMFPYMEAIEHNIPPSAAQRADGADLVRAYHGFNGPVNVSFPVPMRIPAAQRIYKAAVGLVFGIATSPDLSARTWQCLGVHVMDDLSKQQDTLTVLTEHTVAKVTFDKHLKATGLQFGSAATGDLYTVKAKYEVLLAAGSLATPPILERSGIGSKSVLNSFGIKQLVELPGVGLNLQDQPGTGLSALVQTVNASNSLLIDNRNIFAPVITLLNIDQLFGNESAALSAQLKKDTKARAQAAVANGAAVDVQSAAELYTTVTNLITKNKMPITELISESYPAVMSSAFWPLLPFSRGHIHINSSDPFAAPRITPHFLSDDFDVKVAIRISKQARALYQTPPFAPIISVLVVDAVPANATDSQWAEWYSSTAFGASHWLGSSAMRPRTSGGVVSPTLEVYGTSGLRIVDASVIPFQVTSHTMSLIYAISQKAADIVLSCR
ncbi:hypothetical protein DFH09DRAFT_1316335 [Mycena vulgaris]|nr:hypothetical protein DFH09DRAFT_1316335 [Mycena vulgaris]